MVRFPPLESKEEIVLNYIVERKRIDDLASSIVDGRFKEQKFRLSKCGADDVIYLVEEKKSIEHTVKLDPDRLETAMIHSQIHDDFFLKRTDSFDDTLGYLSVLTFQIENIYKKKRLVAVGGDITSRKELEQLRASLHDSTRIKHHIAYDLFDKINGKERNLSQRDMFLKQLIQVRTLGLDKALAITAAYPTLMSLLKAYERLQTEKEKEDLLVDLPVGTQKKKLGIQVSKKLYHLYCLDKY